MSRFKVGDKAKCGVSEVTILGVASNGMYACEYDNGAVGFLNPSDLMPPEQVVRWVHLWCDNDITINKEPKQGQGMVIARARVVLKPGQFDDETDPYTKGWDDAIEAASNEMVKIGATDGGRIIAPIRALKRSAP